MSGHEVRWVDFPAGRGHVQAGRRPAVVPQAPQFGRLPTVLVVPFTSRIAATRFQGTLLVGPRAANGLSVPSVLLVFQLTAVDRERVEDGLGELEMAHYESLPSRLDELIAREPAAADESTDPAS